MSAKLNYRRGGGPAFAGYLPHNIDAMSESELLTLMDAKLEQLRKRFPKGIAGVTNNDELQECEARNKEIEKIQTKLIMLSTQGSSHFDPVDEQAYFQQQAYSQSNLVRANGFCTKCRGEKTISILGGHIPCPVCTSGIPLTTKPEPKPVEPRERKIVFEDTTDE